MKTTCWTCLIWITLAGPAFAIDAFDKARSAELKQATDGKTALTEVTAEGAAKWKTLGKGIDSPSIIVRTGDGNWTKALIGWGFRKKGDQPIPVLVFERFVTYDANREDNSLATGKEVMLFPGLAFDFDIGQVVPADLGGDVTVTEKGVLQPVGTAQLFSLDSVPGGDETPAADPDDHEGVLPRDFAGTWDLAADGRWAGTLELTVNAEGAVSGKYLSTDTQSSYPAYGKVGGPAPHHLRMEIEFANSIQTFDGWLWTKGKGAMAGTTTLAGRKFGFYAVRAKK